MISKKPFVVSVITLVFSFNAFACDPCMLYGLHKIDGHQAGGLTLEISEQYTNFDKSRERKKTGTGNTEEVKDFSTTQFSLSYDLTDKAGIQLTLPLLYRRFDEVKDHNTISNSDSGLGDISIVGNYNFLDYKSGDFKFSSDALIGIKIPTGDTGALSEFTEKEEDEGHHDKEESHHKSIRLKHHPISSVSGGRVLSLGTGSYDYIFGMNFIARYNRYLSVNNIQYTYRTEGDFNYRFADDLLWSSGAGYYLYLDHSFNCAGLITISGESKAKDKQDGQIVSGSQISNLYVGPQLIFTFNQNLGFDLGAGFRVTGEDVNSVVVPEMKIRSGVFYRF